MSTSTLTIRRGEGGGGRSPWSTSSPACQGLRYVVSSYLSYKDTLLVESHLLCKLVTRIHRLELNMNSAFSPSARAVLVSLLGFLGDSFFR